MNQEQHDGGVYYFETETPGQCCGFMNTWLAHNPLQVMSWLIFSRRPTSVLIHSFASHCHRVRSKVMIPALPNCAILHQPIANKTHGAPPTLLKAHLTSNNWMQNLQSKLCCNGDTHRVMFCTTSCTVFWATHLLSEREHFASMADNKLG